MDIHLPPLTLCGALVLRGGKLQREALGLADGGLCKPGGLEVDLSGFAICPGAVDLGGVLAREDKPEAALRALAGEAVRAGTTSLWVGVDWPDDPDDLPGVRARIARIETAATDVPVDLRLRVNVGTHGLATGAALLQALAGMAAPIVAFTHPTERARIAAEAAFGGGGPLARHLCFMASGLDEMGLRYGTIGDHDGELRERFSMIGARMVLRPSARGAAASARAMGEPVMLAASDILSGGVIGRGLASMLIAEGMCDALGSFGAADGPGQVVRHLVDQESLPLGHAWALLSSAPAGILRLADRGGLVPGCRADLAIIDPENLEIEATICGGRLIHATPAAVARFAAVIGQSGLAAE